MANKDQNEMMCISHLGSNDETDPADVSEATIRHKICYVEFNFPTIICNNFTRHAPDSRLA